jgi:FkbM family methyltransferase
MSSAFVEGASAGAVQRMANRVTAPFRGYGMERVPGLRSIYNAVYSAIAPVGESEIETSAGRLWVDFRDRSIVPSLWITGRYEATYSRALDTLVDQHSTVFDIGAHVGYHAVRFARKGAWVEAFEPCPENRRLLVQNVLVNSVESSVGVRAEALSDAPGPGDLWIDERNTGAAALSLACVPSAVRKELVDIRSLDTIDLRKKPDLIKVDVQGSEAAVLRGALGLISSTHPNIGFEYNASQIESSGDDPGSLRSLLADQGYVAHIADEHSGTVFEVSWNELHEWCMREKADGTGFANVIALRPEE